MKSILSGKEMEKHIKYAKDRFASTGEVGSLFIFNLEGKVVPLTTDRIFEQYDKRFVMANMGKYYMEKYHRRIDEVVFICEAWYLEKKPKEKVDYTVRPSESPDRKEGVMILGRDRSGNYVSRTFDIDRIKNELVENKKMTSADSFIGILDYIFDPQMAMLKEKIAYNKNKNVN